MPLQNAERLHQEISGGTLIRFERPPQPVECGRDVGSTKRVEIGIERVIDGYTMLGAERGQVLMVCANGSDAEKALDAIVRLFESNFDEE